MPMLGKFKFCFLKLLRIFFPNVFDSLLVDVELEDAEG